MVIPKSVLDSIRESACGISSHLFGRFVSEEDLVQVAGLEQRWRGLVLDKVGEWTRVKNIPSHPGGDDSHVHLYVSSDGLVAHADGNKMDVHVYDTADYHSRHRNILISQKLHGKKAMLVGVQTS